MKKIFLFSFLAALFMLTFTNTAHAQRKGKKKKGSKTDQYFDESGSIKDNLFGGAYANFPRFSNGTFAMQVSPYIGYKLTPKFGAGVVTKFDYYYERIQDPQVEDFTVLDFSGGIFARYKIIPALFAQVEYEMTRFERLPTDAFGNQQIFVEDGKIVTENITQPHMYLGLGYSSGNNLLSYNISLYYNVLHGSNNIRIPWDLRFGFAYNF